MNFTSLLAALFPSLFDAAAAKIIHQVAGSGKGGAAIQAIQQVAEPWIAQQVGIHLANGTTPATAPNAPISLSQFLPPGITFNSVQNPGGKPE